MFSTLIATRVWNCTRPSVAVITSRSRNSRTASTRPAASGMSWGWVTPSRRPGSQHVEQVPLVLAHSPADRGELDRAHHARRVGGRLLDADDAPLQHAERLPPPQRFTVDRPPAGRLVAV